MFGKFLHWLCIIFVRSCFVATSLTPVFFVLGIGEFERYCEYKGTADEIALTNCLIYIAICVTLFFVCRVMLWLKQSKDSTSLPIDKLNRKDNELLSFLFIFVLPLMTSENSLFGILPVTTIACFLIIILAIADVGAYHFNPIIRLWGYRIYSVEVSDRDSILIARSRRVLRSAPDRKIKVVKIADGIYLHHWKKMRE